MQTPESAADDPIGLEANEGIRLGAELLGAVVTRLSTYGPDDMAKLLATHTAHDDGMLEATMLMYERVIGQGSVFERDDSIPHYEQQGARILEAKNRSDVMKKLAQFGMLDAANFNMAGMKYGRYAMQTLDIFNDPSRANPDGCYDLYPGVAAYFLKSVVGYDSPARRRLIDDLDDQQIVQLVGYACLINGSRRRKSIKNSDSDIQAQRLLMNLGGMSDAAIHEAEGGKTKDTSPIRRSRRSVIKNLREYSDLLIGQISEMVTDDEYSLFENDPAKGIVFAPELVAGLQSMLRTTEHMTPLKIAEIAIRRYVANALIDKGVHGDAVEEVVGDVRAMWLKLNGVSSPAIQGETGLTTSRQDAAFLNFRKMERHELPVNRAFWRLVEECMGRSMTVVTSESGLTAASLATLEDHKPEMPDVAVGMDDRTALSISDKKFRRRMRSIVEDGKLAAFLEWAVGGSVAWYKAMLCRDDPDSIEVPKSKPHMSPELYDRCVSCPVRERCLGNALAEPRSTGDPYRANYFYAGYSPEERDAVLSKSNVDWPALQPKLARARTRS